MGSNNNPLASDTDPLEQYFQKQNFIQPGQVTPDEDEEEPGKLAKVGSVLGHVLNGLSAFAPDGGRQVQRQSTREMLQQRLGLKRQEDAQKQADWQQTYNLRNRSANEATDLNRAKILESQTNAGNVEKQREFNQAAEAGKLFTGGWQQAGQPDLYTGAAGEVANPPSTAATPGQFPPDTKGRPMITAGGSTLIPPSPEEATQLDITKRGQEANAKTKLLNDNLSALQNDPDPAIQQYIKNNPSLIGRLKVHDMFGFEPKEDDANTLAIMAANGNKPAADAMKLLKPPKAGETDQDIKLRDPSLDPKVDDPSVLEGETNKVKSLVGQLVNYDVQPGGFSLRDPDWKRAMALASQMRPSFSMQNYRVQQDTKRSFSSGKDAQNIQSFNTVVDHIADFDAKTKALNNTNVHIGNRLLNAAHSEGPGGYPELRAAEKAANAVENELASTFKGGAPTDQETKQWRNTIQFDQTPKELHEGGAQEATKLMLSRAASAQKKWEDAMGSPVRSPIFSKHAAETIDKVMDQPGYTQRFMNDHSRFGEDNTAVNSTDSMTTGSPAGPPAAKTGLVTMRAPSGKTRTFDSIKDAAALEKLRHTEGFTEVK